MNGTVNAMNELIELVRMQLGCARIRLQDRFTTDLGAESFDLVRLAASVENHFRIHLPEEQLSRIRTVNDLWNLVRSMLA